MQHTKIRAALSEDKRSIDPVVVEYLKCKGHSLQQLNFEANPNIMMLLMNQSININSWCPNLHDICMGSLALEDFSQGTTQSCLAALPKIRTLTVDDWGAFQNMLQDKSVT